MRRTNIVLNEDLLEKAKSLTGIKTIRELVDHALRELVRHRRQRDIMKLRGKINWEGELSKMRRGRSIS
jgi:Arc/MetJ family transcription regulator